MELSETQQNLIKEIVLNDFETGNITGEDFFLTDEESEFENVEQKAADFYVELTNLGPAGFYEEFQDELEFSDAFRREYGIED